MAGRGRGRGSQFSAIQDSLGIGRERVENQSLNDPPPIYPPLSNRPHLPLKGQEHEYMLAVMKDFVNQMRDSQFALQKPSVKTIENKGIQIGRLNDKVENMTQKPLTGIGNVQLVFRNFRIFIFSVFFFGFRVLQFSVFFAVSESSYLM